MYMFRMMLGTKSDYLPIQH